MGIIGVKFILQSYMSRISLLHCGFAISASFTFLDNDLHLGSFADGLERGPLYHR
jgi:hypothetical protein